MRIYGDLSLRNFRAWCGALDTLNRVIEEGKCEELEAILEELYPEGIDDGTLNDILWFDWATVYEWLGIYDEDEEDDENEEDYMEDEEYDD